MIAVVECVQCGKPARHVATILYLMPTRARGVCEMHFCDTCHLLQVPRDDYQRIREARPDLAPDDPLIPPPNINLN